MVINIENKSTETQNVILLGDTVFPTKQLNENVLIEYSEDTKGFKLDYFTLNVTVNSDKYFDFTKPLMLRRVEYGGFKSEYPIYPLHEVINSDYEEYKENSTNKELSLDISDKRFKDFDGFNFIELEINAGAKIKIEIKELVNKLEGFKFGL